MAKFAGKTEPNAGDIVVNKDFGITGNTADLQFLTQAVLAAKLDNETLDPNCKRRGIAPIRFDPKSVQAANRDRKRPNSTRRRQRHGPMDPRKSPQRCR
jgi:hypothetical protein